MFPNALPPTSMECLELAEEKESKTRFAALLKSIESFTADLYKYVADHEEGNFVFSGLSVYLASAICALGAEENTAKETLDTLHINKDSLSSDFRKFIVTHLEDVENIELIVASRIFADKIIKVKDSFKERIRDCFDSDVIDVDFVLQFEKAIEVINDWCAEKTKNKIKDMVSENSIQASTKMVIANVVYFKAGWLHEFDSMLTSNEPFFIAADALVDVPTMHISEKFMYKDLESLNAELVAIPYSNPDYLFVIIKPKAINGLKQLEMNLHQIELDFDGKLGKKSNFEHKYIQLELPKFKIESRINLSKNLKKLGMIEMFQENANLTGISERKPLFVDEVLQKALIEVDEKGTEAIAVTCYDVADCIGLSRQGREFKVDRPFLCRIVKRSSNLTLFSGRVVRPIYD